jgi:hypothetical protein
MRAVKSFSMKKLVIPAKAGTQPPRICAVNNSSPRSNASIALGLRSSSEAIALRKGARALGPRFRRDDKLGWGAQQ